MITELKPGKLLITRTGCHMEFWLFDKNTPTQYRDAKDKFYDKVYANLSLRAFLYIGKQPKERSEDFLKTLPDCFTLLMLYHDKILESGAFDSDKEAILWLNEHHFQEVNAYDK